MATGPVVCSAFVESGRLKVRNKHFLETALSALRDGEYELRIDRKRATRSEQQNRYWWGVCVELVSEHTGYTPEEVHEFAKQTFLPKKLAMADGNGEIVGECVIGGSTTKLDKIQFGEFVERFRQWAAETLDIVIPDPE